MTSLALSIGTVLIVGMLSLAGLLMSCLSLSGTWLVALAAALVALSPVDGMPGWMLFILYLAIATAVEGIEFLAGVWGVRRRHGSRLASWAALVGGLAGMVMGTLIPIPVFGPLVGMVAMSFVLVYAVERHRLQASAPAAHIAFGTVLSRVAVIFVKIGTTLAMSIWLLYRTAAALW